MQQNPNNSFSAWKDEFNNSFNNNSNYQENPIHKQQPKNTNKIQTKQRTLSLPVNLCKKSIQIKHSTESQEKIEKLYIKQSYMPMIKKQFQQSNNHIFIKKKREGQLQKQMDFFLSKIRHCSTGSDKIKTQFIIQRDQHKPNKLFSRMNSIQIELFRKCAGNYLMIPSQKDTIIDINKKIERIKKKEIIPLQSDIWGQKVQIGIRRGF